MENYLQHTEFYEKFKNQWLIYFIIIIFQFYQRSCSNTLQSVIYTDSFVCPTP